MRPPPENLAFKARALAQGNPLTPLARRLVDRAVAEQRLDQPMPEAGMWADAALVAGYCVRRVEEAEAGLAPEFHQAGAPDLDELDRAATRIAGELRTDTVGHALGDADVTVAALDRIIASEVSRRLNHWKDDVDQAAWDELEEYLTWWVVKGYALRTAERATGAIR